MKQGGVSGAILSTVALSRDVVNNFSEIEGQRLGLTHLLTDYSVIQS
jgi:hypothetical protein